MRGVGVEGREEGGGVEGGRDGCRYVVRSVDVDEEAAEGGGRVVEVALGRHLEPHALPRLQLHHGLH